MYAKIPFIGRSAELARLRRSSPLPVQTVIQSARRGVPSFKYSTKVQPSHETLASFSMKEKVVVVTGAAAGLGKTFAKAFLES
ncbi:hypothetical protein FRC01_003886 [Tulasnella sp. 417]|nr:hypothetical protein FRC01_003886 [Tulasnella sp. 417]